MCDHVNDPGGREGAMIVIAPGVHCDPCIAPFVRALNESGLPRVPTKHGPDGVATVASCCGHGKRPGSVMLADGRDLLILDSAESDRIGGLWPGINGEPATHAVTPEPVIHVCPRNGEGLTPCCGRSPVDIPRTDRMTIHREFVTCLAATPDMVTRPLKDQP